MHALLALEDGHVFHGRSFGDPEEAGGEVVFCTAMCGYQEVLTDPSYHGQIVVFTAPHVGNYGIQSTAEEAPRPWAAGVIVREACDTPSHPDSTDTLRHYLRRHRLCGLTGLDTRALTLHLRQAGALRGWFTTRIEDPEEAIARARAIPPMRERDLVSEVSAENVRRRRPFAAGGPPRARLAVLDYGVKESILRELVARNCEAIVLPASASPEAIDAHRPDGVVLSNGPGDPETLLPLLTAVRHCVDRYPTLAICLGHQLAGLALGGRVVKLRFGHHGVNHPVQDRRSGRVMVTSQNHNYALDPDRLPSSIDVTHVNLNDGTIEGFVHPERRLWSYQFHPEGAPGPRESREIFDDFVGAVAPVEGGRAS